MINPKDRRHPAIVCLLAMAGGFFLTAAVILVTDAFGQPPNSHCFKLRGGGTTCMEQEPLFRYGPKRKGMVIPHCLNVAQYFHSPSWPCWDADEKKVIGPNIAAGEEARYLNGETLGLTERYLSKRPPKYDHCPPLGKSNPSDHEKLYHCWEAHTPR